MKIILLLISLSICSFSIAQSEYIYDNIPDSLKKNADYIIWEHTKDFKVKNIGEAIDLEKIAVCVVNQHSKRYNTIYKHYSKGEHILMFKAEIYDANGNLVKRLKMSEIKDNSAVSSFSLFEDDRVRLANFTHNQYPYTLVFEYKKTVKGLLNYPSWYFQSQSNTSVILSKIKITLPEKLNINYKEYNLSKEGKVTEHKGDKSYEWVETNLIPYESVEKAPSSISYKPILRIVPQMFEEGGYTGVITSWSSFGKWSWLVNKDRDVLPLETYSEIKKLVKDVKSDKEKVKILYEYMQNKTRYVSVQLGIGGYQTFPADYVDLKGHGDCKALSNYMYTLLKRIGIKSHYTLIKAGKYSSDIEYNFPGNQFNHVILCVPLEKDTVWLECTSQQQPFNFLGSFTDDRHALLITENGGKLVKTPRYGKDVSTQYRSVDLKLEANGNAVAKVNTKFNGLQYENREGWANESVKEQKEAIKGAYGISGMEINNFKFTEYKEKIPSIHEELDLTLLRFASTSSKRMFIKMNVFNQSSYVPKNEERKIPFRLTYEFTDIDTVNFEIPEGYKIENKPKDYNMKNQFGEYSCKFEQDGNNVKFIRKQSSEKGVFPAEDYKAYFEYRKKIKKADKAKLVLVKNT